MPTFARDNDAGIFWGFEAVDQTRPPCERPEISKRAGLDPSALADRHGARGRDHCRHDLINAPGRYGRA